MKPEIPKPLPHSRRQRRIRILRWLAKAAARTALGGAIIGGIAFAISYAAIEAPLEEAANYPAALVIRDNSGRILRVLMNAEGNDLRPSYSAAAGDWIVAALVASEDKRFFKHRGIDIVATLRAVKQNFTTFRRISGASTITSQSIRLIHPARRTYGRKYVEAFQALKLERRLSKTEILTQYLNRAPFGSNIYGIEAAAQVWFGKTAKSLSIGEAALLAGIVQSPTRFRPDTRLERALKRRDYVLGRMLTLGAISQEQHAAAVAEPIFVTRSRPFLEPFYTNWLVGEFQGRGADSDDPAASAPADFDIATPLDPRLQAALRRRLREHAAAGNCSAAGVIIRVSDGEVLAMDCSDEYSSLPDGQFNTALARRQPGSTLKPFAMAQALDLGIHSPSEILDDSPRAFGAYAPANFDGGHRGAVSARDALILSLNIPFLDMARKIGVPEFHALLASLGLSTIAPDPARLGLGLAIGNTEIRLLDLARAYASLAHAAATPPSPPPTPHSPIPPTPNSTLHTPHFSPAAAYIVTDMLSGHERSAAAFGHNADAILPRAAWKTGTSAGNRDAWCFLWNPEIVIGIWCGHKSGAAGGETLTGSAAAAPVAWGLFRDILPSPAAAPWFACPDGIYERQVCAQSGLPLSIFCGESTSGLAIRGRSPQEPCDARRHPVRPADATLASAAPPAPSQLKIISPADKTIIKTIPALAEKGLALIPRDAPAASTLWWFLDGAPIATSSSGASARIPFPASGAHTLTCADASGAAATITFTIE